jgi:hypothetical protein
MILLLVYEERSNTTNALNKKKRGYSYLAMIISMTVFYAALAIPNIVTDAVVQEARSQGGNGLQSVIRILSQSIRV